MASMDMGAHLYLFYIFPLPPFHFKMNTQGSFQYENQYKNDSKK